MKKSSNSLTIFKWNDLDIEELKEVHERVYKMRLCTEKEEGRFYYDEDGKWRWDVNFIEIPKEGRKEKKINWNILLPKYMFLCHNIIARCSGIKGGATFNASILEQVLGGYYSIMLETLVDCKCIWLGTYKVGEKSRTIWLRNLSICRETTTNKKIISYNKKMKELVKDLYKPLSKDLFTPYCKALKTLTLNQEEAKRATKEQFSSFLNKEEGNLSEKEYNKQEIEYTWRMSRIDTFEYSAPKQDENGRIYHYLTNFPKELLQYTNIKYELDASNCHPMLLCLFLIYIYNISSIKINNKYHNLNSSTIYIHYLMNFLHKAFTVSELGELEKNMGNSVPEDVEKYIQRTFSGTFWDDYVYRFPNVKRGEVKQIMFAEVFYSYDNEVYVRDKTVKDKFKVKRVKKYARAFKEDYPNVWKLIGQLKKIGEKRLGNNPTDEKNSFFPCVMMCLESTIFREILRRCYDRGYTNIVNIHDAICVIENDTLNYTSDDIKNIMLEVFQEYGLYPNIKLEKIQDSET